VLRLFLVCLWLAVPTLPALAGIYTWLDDDGVTHIVDDPSLVPESKRDGASQGRQGLGELWDDGVAGSEFPTKSGEVGQTLEQRRIARLVRGAVSDLERGETARATTVLRSVLRMEPKRPEPHWYLALLARQRGRYDEAEAHLRSFLVAAGDDFTGWQAAARRKLEALEDERRLADEDLLEGPDRWIGVEHPHFRVHYHEDLGKASADYPNTVLRYLEDAHAAVAARLGAVPSEPLGVMFYGKAAYLRAHRHRFSFQTVGFFDGRIHVVSAAHPAGELRALLFHEYAHAVFRERTGGDRPFWFNEGMAELLERSSRRTEGFTRSELSSLRQRIAAGRWISLRRLAPSFSGLKDEDARAAYLESTVAASWLEGRTTPAQRRELLEGFGAGRPDDEVFEAVLGLTTAQIDAQAQAWIRAEFPADRPLEDEL